MRQTNPWFRTPTAAQKAAMQSFRDAFEALAKLIEAGGAQLPPARPRPDAPRRERGLGEQGREPAQGLMALSRQQRRTGPLRR